jgi:hypothetical protein
MGKPSKEEIKQKIKNLDKSALRLAKEAEDNGDKQFAKDLRDEVASHQKDKDK